MKKLLLFSLLQLFVFSSYCQIQLLKNFDFERGGYALVGCRSESDKNGLADSLGEFYTEDINILNQFKKEWVFKKPSPQYACGYHYIISICKNGLMVDRFYINLNCNEIATNKGYFYFDTGKLRMFRDKVKSLYPKYDEFNSMKEARTARAKMLTEKNLLLIDNPAWVNYEGEFNFIYTCKKGDNDCMETPKKLLKELRDEIKKTYPGEPFELEEGGGSKNELFVNVKCNQTLAEKFRLYPVSWKKWEAYKPDLNSFWKKKV
jgi:hypothetical protein